ncbi:HAD-IIIC family phosphatase [Paenibacillus chitinolyticus]|uniref:HAD-IIIC family phosphatase n=1 Tax=Paenibacillus chitinolyticus TaxID=79263 RepID=UPI002DBAE11C|nr:HAD-IIIC family phosphatase [Paenibacillus chitinolyticus]MEC0248500.1 HAD-IIIC family phosphatase [Paenibacillus chitinolyticus]
MDTTAEPIKLVIWDMDQTFWKGVISEEPVLLVEEHIQVLKELAHRGIMNSICSLNSFKQVKDMLEDHGLWHYFVFPEINWNPKGKLIKKIIAGCKLRPQSVLFIDDEPSHLHEARFENPGIRICTPDRIRTLPDLPELQGSPDPELKQLEKFKILEKSAKSLGTSGSSNVQFLKDSRICVDIVKDCLPHQERIFEMMYKTAQLNFTKNRISRDELLLLIEDASVDTGCIHVRDRFGDYGITGFYALKDNRLLHYFFSCRIMNFGVEQWLYHHLGTPEIQIAGGVAATLTSPAPPTWITHVSLSDPEPAQSGGIRCLIKGGCDLEQVQHYLNFYRSFDWETEYWYLNENSDQLRNDHTEYIVQAPVYTEEQLDWLTRTFPFFDGGMLRTSMFEDRYDVVIYSVLLDYKAAVYRPKRYPEITLAFGSHYLPLTDESNFDLVIERTFIELDHSTLRTAKEELEFTGPLSAGKLVENLAWIRGKLPEKTVLILVNGSEVPIWDRAETDMHIHHAAMNAALRSFTEKQANTYLVDVGRILTSPQDHTDSLTHYTRKAYKQIAEAIVEIIEEKFGMDASLDSKDKREMKLMEMMMSEYVPSQYF